jgi:inner membrane protein
MASLGHVAVGLAAARWEAQRERRPLRPSRAGLYAALALLPDLDVIAFRLGIPYEAALGHRGASHSLLAAIGIGLCAGLAIARPGTRTRTIAFSILVVASHGLLDALTDGGLGVALGWPWSDARCFAPLRPIPVAPIGRRFVSAWGLRVALVELACFAPLLLYAAFRRPSLRSAPSRPPDRR